MSVLLALQPAGSSLTASWSDAVTQTVAFTRVGTFGRSLTSATTQSDSWTRSGTYLRTLAGAVTQTDAWSRIATFRRTLAEAIAHADVWAAVSAPTVIIAGLPPVAYAIRLVARATGHTIKPEPPGNPR